MDSLGIGVSIVMGFFVLFVVVETIYFMLCCNARVQGHAQSTKERDLQQKVLLLKHLCWWKRNTNRRRLAREDANIGVCSASSSSTKENNFGDGQASSQVVVTLCPFQGDAVCSDIWQLGGLLGPPRLLFTIKEEETDQELDCEDGRSRIGKSCRTSRAPSNDFSGSITPIFDVSPSDVTPLCSSPSPLEVLSPLNKLLPYSSELFSPSSSFSLSLKTSSPHSKPLSNFMQEPPSPFSMSPPRLSQNRTLGSFFQAPPNSSPGLLSHPNRVYPLGEEGRGGAVAGMGGEYCRALRKGASMQRQIEGIPIFGGGRKLGVETSLGPSWPPSPPLSSGRSSPFRISSSFHPSPYEEVMSGLFFELQKEGNQGEHISDEGPR